MTRHVMITGAAGQLGTDLARLCAREGDRVSALSRSDLSIDDRNAVVTAVARLQPDLIINCGAWTAVDGCEADPERADHMNGHAVGFLAEAAAATNAHLVQVSTDYVFDGTKIGPYQEADLTNPQSAYGRSKLLGERLAGDHATVVRTSWVCSAHGGNMVATILRIAAQHDVLRFVADQRGRPTFTTDLAQALRSLAVDRVPGMFHFANHGEVSWFAFARAVLDAAGLDPECVLPIATADLDPPRPAPRPTNSVLSTDRYERLGYGPIRPFAEPLSEVIPAYRS